MKLKLDLKNPRLRTPLLIGLTAVIGIVLWYQQILTPGREQLVELNKRVKAKQDTLRTIQALKTQLNGLKEELNSAQQVLDSLKSIFPDQKEVPKLIREITSVARASGINTTKFNPQPDIEKEYYVENHYNISVEGGYHDLAEFFAFLANFTLIINLSSVKIATHSGLERGITQDMLDGSPVMTIESSFEMTTFSSKK